VIALGAEYQLCAFKFRGGFNWAKAPFGTNTSENGFETTNFQGKDIFKESTSNFNTILFPAIVESHITLGAAYNVMEGLEVEASFMFAPKKSVIRAGNGINPLTSQPTRPYSVTATAAQWNALLGVKWAL
jgi:long-chain fatty acid transport protein